MDEKKFGDLVQTGDGSYTILDGSIDEEYHSTYGARSEADELYMINSGFRDDVCAGLYVVAVLVLYMVVTS